MKHILLIAPLAAAVGACASEDIDAFANGMSQFALELDNQVNPPCPPGAYRQFVPEAVAAPYPHYSYQQLGYQLTPGGYSYCAYPATTYYSDDHRTRHGHSGEDDRYADGYRDGYRDGQRDD